VLTAELNGHVVPEAKNNEDYLTSTVFGHLRYIPPAIFWSDLFERAFTLPIGGRALSLRDQLRLWIGNVDKYQRLHVFFWPSHPTLGIPDLILIFTGPNNTPLMVLVEARLTRPRWLVRFRGAQSKEKRLT
jgi:hypothetical protein